MRVSPWLALLAVTLSALPVRAEVRLDPAGMQALAAADVVTLPPATQVYTRYLGLWSEDPERLAMLARMQALHDNLLSTEPEIVLPVVVPGSEGWLLRINLLDYGISPKVWERLKSFDPFFSVNLVTEETEEVGAYFDGRGQRVSDGRYGTWRKTGDKKTGKSKKTAAAAPWLSETPQQQAALKILTEATQSQVPVVGAGWFVFQTAIQQDRGNAGYTNFLGFSSEKEFQQLIGFDAKILERFPLQAADAVANSGVTLQPRAITRDGKIGGSYLRTLDIATKATDSKNPLRVLDPRRNLDFDASEQMGHLPNGMLATGLFNNKGVLQNVAPQAVALDRHGTRNDLNVHIGTISCFRCHDKIGVATIKPWVRDVLNRAPLALNVADEKERVRARNLYVSNLEEALEDDRRLFARAIIRATGMEPQKALTEYADLWERYTAPVTLARAARELGVEKAVFVAALDRQAKVLGSTDTVLATYLRPEMPPQRARELGQALKALRDGPEPLPIDVWLEAYPLAQLALRGAVVPIVGKP